MSEGKEKPPAHVVIMELLGYAVSSVSIQSISLLCNILSKMAIPKGGIEVVVKFLRKISVGTGHGHEPLGSNMLSNLALRIESDDDLREHYLPAHKIILTLLEESISCCSIANASLLIELLSRMVIPEDAREEVLERLQKLEQVRGLGLVPLGSSLTLLAAQIANDGKEKD